MLADEVIALGGPPPGTGAEASLRPIGQDEQSKGLKKDADTRKEKPPGGEGKGRQPFYQSLNSLNRSALALLILREDTELTLGQLLAQLPATTPTSLG